MKKLKIIYQEYVLLNHLQMKNLKMEKFQIGNQEFLEAKKDNYKYMGGYNSGLTAFTTMINLIVIIVGGFCITREIVNVTDMITFLLYINIFTDPIKTLIDFTEQFQNGYSGFERFLEILEIEPDIKDNADAIELNDVKEILNLMTFHLSIMTQHIEY